jgi:hypothetical protein
MDIQDTVLVDFEARRRERRPAEIRGTRESGIYATRVKIEALQGSCYDGLTGTVVRVAGETAFVRLRPNDGREVTIPFGLGELEVIS